MNAENSCECPVCSGNLVFDIKSASLICPGGHVSYPIASFDRIRKAAPEQQPLTCQRCGGTISPAARELVRVCPFCGRSVRKAPRREDSSEPDFAVPFARGRVDFVNILRMYCQTHPSVPEEFSRAITPARIRPAYIPFFVCEALTAEECSIDILGKNDRTAGQTIRGEFSLSIRGLSETLTDQPFLEETFGLHLQFPGLPLQ